MTGMVGMLSHLSVWIHLRGVWIWIRYTALFLGLRIANERRHYFVTTSLIGWAEAESVLGICKSVVASWYSMDQESISHVTITIQIRWKNNPVPIQILIKWLLQKFAHCMTAMLLCNQKIRNCYWNGCLVDHQVALSITFNHIMHAVPCCTI